MTENRFASARKNGHNGSTRRVRPGQNQASKFDEDGDEFVEESSSVLWERYLKTEKGSRHARACLDELLATRKGVR